MGRRGAEAGSTDAVRMPGSPVPCAVWVPRVGGRVTSYPPGFLPTHPGTLFSSSSSLLSLFLSLSMKKPVSGKALCLSEKYILQEPSMSVDKQEAEGVQLGRGRKIFRTEMIWGR